MLDEVKDGLKCQQTLADRFSKTFAQDTIRPESVEGRCQLFSGSTSSPSIGDILLKRSASKSSFKTYQER